MKGLKHVVETSYVKTP